MKTFLLLLSLAATLHAQNPTPRPQQPASGSSDPKQPHFRCELPGGTYVVAVRVITAVSRHEYLVDGLARVTEVNVDTTGALLARFYFIEPATPTVPSSLGAATIEKAQQLFKEAAERSGQDVWKKVVKNYPTTTHSRTVEYRVTDKEHLARIHGGAEQAFLCGKTVEVKIE